ncbi:MAG TPA: dynamin family protein, partial [Chloroflexota bacterium]|nr:dynamin family protein [Chloroflexota bacterium]
MNVETRLSPYFSAIPETDIPDVLQPVARLRDGFGASTLRVVVFGGARNGKSSLINALSGAEMLPVHSLGPGHPIVELRHDTDPRASIVRADGTEAEVSIDEGRRIARGIVEAVTRITMWAPFPFLSDNVALVDTPPLTGGDGADEWAIMTELESADIALMVLSADKILSRSERELARRAGRLLGDNMWFVVNRIDLVEESELDEVMAWAAG